MRFVKALLLCGVISLAIGAMRLSADDWPHWQGPRADGIWREQGIVDTFPAGGRPVRWRTPIGAGYSSPAVANGRVFLTDRPNSETRGNPGGALQRAAETGRERVLCLDERDGRVLWQHEYECPYFISYPAGPRASPAVAGNRVYTLGAEGDLHCLDVGDGPRLGACLQARLWSHYADLGFRRAAAGGRQPRDLHGGRRGAYRGGV